MDPRRSERSGELPDLAVEIEVTRSSLDRLAIYASIGVPQVWRWTSNGELLVLSQPGVYDEVPTSMAFPGVSLEQFKLHVDIGLAQGPMVAVRRWRKYVRSLATP